MGDGVVPVLRNQCWDWGRRSWCRDKVRGSRILDQKERERTMRKKERKGVQVETKEEGQNSWAGQDKRDEEKSDMFSGAKNDGEGGA